MVFCYNIITETPRRAGNVSFRKTSQRRKLPNVPTTLTNLISTTYEDESILDSIPEREWRLLAAIARKREEDVEREQLADQFRKMWQKEKDEREMVEAETSDQYKRYIHKKRQQERSWHEHQQMLKSADQQIRRGQLIDCIRHKEKRAQDLLAWREDQKTSELLDKAIEEEARAVLAADRRYKQVVAEDCRKRLQWMHTQCKAKEAKSKRSAMLRDAAQRVAISNSLNTWESSILRQEINAMEAAKRAHHAAHAAITSARSENLIREREIRKKRARKMAAVTAQMRIDLKAGLNF